MTKLLCTSALAIVVIAVGVVPAQAQVADSVAIQQELTAMRAQMTAMARRIDTLEGQLVAAQAEVAAIPPPLAASAPPTVTAKAPTEIAWEGAPRLITKEGWSFKPRGRLLIDAGTVSSPGALASSTLGFATRVRRARLGAEGTVPGGFGYKVELDFANAAVGFADAWLSYAPTKAPVLIRIGNFETLNGLEQISSSNFTSFVERAAFNDAFVNTRRLGGAVAVRGKNDSWRAEAGLFAAHSIDGSLDNDGLIGAARLAFAPKAMGGQFHFGANFQYRDFASNAGGVASASVGSPSTNQLARYRARPNTQLTDLRFIDTGSFAARSDQIVGLEAAAIFKGLYFAGEAQWLKADTYSAGDRATGLNAFGGGNVAVVSQADPGFFGGYAEVGYFLTGETRGYSRSNATWARTKVLNPVGKGGIGAVQIAARVEHVDLDDDALAGGTTNDFTAGTGTLAPLSARLGRGGRQTSYLLALNWQPIDYVRFMVDYGRIDVTGGPFAAQVDPLSALPVNQRKYGVDVVQTRMQIDF